MPHSRPFAQVDVFTAHAYLGNPLAVVLDGAGLDDAAMQGFARWTNLSETTFVLPPSPDAAALQRRDPSPSHLAQVAAALGLQARHIVAAQLLDNGPVWLGLLLDSADTVLQLRPDHLALKNLGSNVGVASMKYASPAPALIARSNREARAFGSRSAAVPAAPDDGTLQVRAFAAPLGVAEDPVTGSLNASLAQWLIAEGHAPARYTAHQGTCLDREGRVYLEHDNAGQVWVGGDSVTCIHGQVTL